MEVISLVHVKRTAGAETHVVIGLARVGLQVAWCRRLDTDSIGRCLLQSIKAEGIERSHVLCVTPHPAKPIFAREEDPRYSRKVEMAEIVKNDFNLNISRYISTAVGEVEIDLDKPHQVLVEIDKAVATAKDKHNAFLRELGLKPLP